jgi:hypothetical protein
MGASLGSEKRAVGVARPAKGVAAVSELPLFRRFRTSRSRVVHHRQRRIDLERHWPHSCIPSRTGPFPVCRAFTQATPNRVVVKVVDHRLERPFIGYVAVVSTSWLPKSATGDVPFNHCGFRQEVWSIVFQPPDRPAGGTYLGATTQPERAAGNSVPPASSPAAPGAGARPC